MTIKGHSRSSEMAPFDRSRRSSYWRSIVTVALSCIFFETRRYCWYPACIRWPRRGWLRRNLAKMFSTGKL